MAISYLQRGRGIDPQNFASRQQSANELYNKSLSPQQPETHWAQGLARVLQSGISGVQNAGISKDREAYAQSQKQDLSRLAQALSGGDYQSALGELSTPDAQMMGLQLAKSDVDRQNMQSQKQQEYDRSREDRRADMGLKFEQQKQLASIRSAGKAAKQENTPLNQALAKKEVEGVTAGIDRFRKEAEGARKLADQSRQVQQMIATNPNLKSGFGRESITAVQGVLNDVFPGSFPDVGDQQAFQKQLGQFTLGGISQLKGSGVKSVTQAEVLHILPKMVAGIGNTLEGVKKITGLIIALEPPTLKAEEAMEWAIKRAQTDPNFNIKEAEKKIEQAKKAGIEAAGLSYFNKDLAQKGERAILNPEYQEGNEKVSKYITLPLNQR